MLNLKWTDSVTSAEQHKFTKSSTYNDFTYIPNTIIIHTIYSHTVTIMHIHAYTQTHPYKHTNTCKLAHTHMCQHSIQTCTQTLTQCFTFWTDSMTLAEQHKVTKSNTFNDFTLNIELGKKPQPPQAVRQRCCT